MPSVEELIRIREAAEYVCNGLMCGCIQMSVEASQAHKELVDRFFFDHPDCVAGGEYEEARLNIFHFIDLVDRAISEWKKAGPS
ncbi:MAG TPA: hypothetical protein PLO63_06060 [Syntrophales bacterium]|nr:hypothetical protein [Syntrophales bacterium]